VADSIIGLRAGEDIQIPGSDTVIAKGRKINAAAVKALRAAGVELRAP